MFVSGIHNSFKTPSFHGKDNERKSSPLKYVLPVAAAISSLGAQGAMPADTIEVKDSFVKSDTVRIDSVCEIAENARLLSQMRVHLNPEFVKKMMSSQTITLDAGHGGKSGYLHNGTNYYSREEKKFYYEKDINLAVAKKVKTYLEQLGTNVIMTRDSDEYVDHLDRALIAQENKSDIFLSIHMDNNHVRRIKGPSVYKYSPELQKGETKLRKINNPQNNALLAEKIHKSVTDLYREDYGYKNFFPVKENDFKVCREANVKRSKDTKIPASALVECGFLSNPDEAKLLITPEHQDKIAKALVKALLNYAFEKTPPELKEKWLNEEKSKYNTYLFSTGLN